jgi:hypothetical protein
MPQSPCRCLQKQRQRGVNAPRAPARTLEAFGLGVSPAEKPESEESVVATLTAIGDYMHEFEKRLDESLTHGSPYRRGLASGTLIGHVLSILRKKIC